MGRGRICFPACCGWHIKKVLTFAGNQQSVGKYGKSKYISVEIDDNFVYILWIYSVRRFVSDGSAVCRAVGNGGFIKRIELITIELNQYADE